MRAFEGKRKFNKIIYSKTALCVLAIVFLFLTYRAVNIYLKSREANKKNDALQEQLAELEKNKADLEKRIAEIQSQSGTEKELREKLNVVRPGEKTIVIVDDKNGKMDIAGNQEGIFSQFWQWVKGLF